MWRAAPGSRTDEERAGSARPAGRIVHDISQMVVRAPDVWVRLARCAVPGDGYAAVRGRASVCTDRLPERPITVNVER
jgi:hypothetical protein